MRAITSHSQRNGVFLLRMAAASLFATGLLHGGSAPSVAQTKVIALSGGGVRIASNPAAGCALWSWTWNGAEFINIRDYGRGIQSSIGLLDRPQGGNPTEAGNRYSDRETLPAGSQPTGSSCVLSESDTTSSLASPIQRTLAIPLEWDPEPFGGSFTHPIVHQEFRIGKEIRLNYHGLGPVAEYSTIVIAEHPISKAAVEIPAIFLRGDLARIDLYDAVTRESASLSVPYNSMSGAIPRSGWGGLIASNEAGTLAFGVYGVRSDQGGSIKGAGAGFQFGRFVDPRERAPYSPSAHSTTKINALTVVPLQGGRNAFRTFLISGTRTDVRRRMDSLAVAAER